MEDVVEVEIALDTPLPIPSVRKRLLRPSTDRGILEPTGSEHFTPNRFLEAIRESHSVNCSRRE